MRIILKNKLNQNSEIYIEQLFLKAPQMHHK